jgi:hypothetical protein
MCWTVDDRLTEWKKEAQERNYGGRLGMEKEESELINE